MRRRKAENQGLPKYLTRHDSRPGYRLQDPIEGTRRYLSDAKYSRADAEREARLVAEKVDAGSAMSLSVLIPRYISYLDQTSNRDTTLKVKRTILHFYRRAWGKYPVTSVTRTLLLEHWETIGEHGWQKHRSIWSKFYEWCIARNYCESNEAQKAGPPPKVERVTQRHTAEGIALIRAKAEPWLQIAIDLAIYSLQDRSTLLAARRSDVTETDEGLVWACTRTKNTKHLEISAPKGTELYKALRRALTHEVAGTYLVRRSVGRRVRSAERSEWSQVLPNYLTQQFAAARVGAYDLPVPQQPGFHQLRAWGAYLYQQAGYPRAYVQALMAHEKAKMTEHYQKGHGEVERVSVEAGL